MQELGPSLVEDGVRIRIEINLSGLEFSLQFSVARNTESYIPKARCPSETLDKNRIYPECKTFPNWGPRCLAGGSPEIQVLPWAQTAAGRGRGHCSLPGSGGGAAHSLGPLSVLTAGSSQIFQPPAGSGLDSDCSAGHGDADLGPLSGAAGCAGSATQQSSCAPRKRIPEPSSAAQPCWGHQGMDASPPHAR